MLVDPLTPVIALLLKSAAVWLPALGETLLTSDITKGQESLFSRLLPGRTKRRQIQHLKLALQQAAECGIRPFQTPVERDQYRDILAVLSQEGFHNEELRRESMRLFTLSETPDLKALSDIYNRARRLQTLSQPQVPIEIDASPYLSSFFSALLNELYNDEIFGSQVREVLNARAAKTTQERLPQISEGIQELVMGVRQLPQATTINYTSRQFEQDIIAYLSYLERTYDSLKLPSAIPEEPGDRDAELNAIFVSPHVALWDTTQSGSLEYDSILTLLKNFPYVVLLGGPGSGKSTITRHLAWSHAAARLPSNSALLSNTPLLPGKPVPLRINLRDFSEIGIQYPDTSIFSYTTEIVLKRMGISVDTQMFNVLLKQNALLFLFDGLDEVTDSDERRTLIDMIEEIVQRYRGNSILVTSRPVGYELFGFSKRWFTHAVVQELDDEQIHQFLELWYTRVLQLAPLPYEDQKELTMLYETLKGNPRLHTLARNPQLLTIITTLHRTERLPDRRVHIYDRSVDLLLDTWSRRRGSSERWQDMQITRDIQRACIAHLGFVLFERLQEREKDGSGTFYGDYLTLTQMQTEVEKFLKSRQLFSPEECQIEAERFLELMRTETGLIVNRGRNEGGEALYGFFHRAFLEYFAALDIYFRQADPPHPDVPGENANTILHAFLMRHLHDPHWQEVILLLFGKLGPVRATVQLDWIAQGNAPGRSAEEEMKDFFFACTCLAEEITVQNRLARMLASRLRELAESVPLQRKAAITALVAMLKTQQYRQLAIEELLALARYANLSQELLHFGESPERIIERLLQALFRVSGFPHYLHLEHVPADVLQIGQELSVVLYLTPNERPNSIPFMIPVNVLDIAIYVEASGFHVVGEHVYSLPVVEGHPMQSQQPFTLIPVTDGELTVRLLVYPNERAEGLAPVIIEESIQVAAPVILPHIPELIDQRMLPKPQPDVILYVSLEEEKEVKHLQMYITCSALNLSRERLEALVLTEDDLIWLRQNVLHYATEDMSLASADALMNMRTLGATLFDQLLPFGHALRKHYWHIRQLARLSTIPWSWLVISDERAILPWELVCPYIQRGDVNAPWYDSFLAETFILAHWIGRQGLALMNEAPLGWLALDHYHQQFQSLYLWHQALGDNVLEGRENTSGHIALMHPDSPYYGLHVLRYINQQQLGQITTSENQTSMFPRNEAEEMLYSHRLDFTLHRPVCGMSFVDMQADGNILPLKLRNVHLEDGWMLPFMHAGASALVGARWPVQPEIDLLFFRTFYQSIRRGTPLGQAVVEARTRVKRIFPYHTDWLAYTYFGHPWCQPYLVQTAQGFALFETLDHPNDAPFQAGNDYRFRASYRTKAPLWYDGRLQIQQEPLQGEGVAVLIMPLTGVMPETYPLQPVPACDDYQRIVTLTMPQQEMMLPVLVRFQREKQELQTLIVNLEVVKKESSI